MSDLGVAEYFLHLVITKIEILPFKLAITNVANVEASEKRKRGELEICDVCEAIFDRALRGVASFLAAHGADVTGVIAGFDRLRLRASLRWLYQPSFMKRYLCEARVLLKDFGAYATALSNRVLLPVL